MREFWVASGHHLTRRAEHGGLVATPELIMAYLARPELMPPDDACDAERHLHASLMADPLQPVSHADIAALADADARENWTFMMNFRDQLIAAPSLEAVYMSLARKGAGDLPPIFLSQLCHLILRNALDGCDDPYMCAPPNCSIAASRRLSMTTRCCWRTQRSSRRSSTPARHAPVAALGHAAAAGVRRDGRDGRRQRLDLLVALRRPCHGDEYRRQRQGARRAVPGDRAMDRPSPGRRRRCRDGGLDRGPRLALVRRPRQRRRPGSATRCGTAPRWTRMRPRASLP